MNRILILYSTVDGYTHKLCQTIADKIHNQEPTVNIEIGEISQSITKLQDKSIQLSQFDTVILGASIRYGKHRPHVVEFINTYRADFNKLNIAFFSVNLVARKPEKNTAVTNPYVVKLLAENNWQPDVVAVFGGKLDYQMYGLFDTLMMKFIMWLTKGVINSDKPIIYTDWNKVDAFVDDIINLPVKNA